MILIRNFSIRRFARFAAKGAVLAIMVAFTASCAEPEQRIISQQQNENQNPQLAIAAVNPSADDPKPAPVPAYGTGTYHAAPYFYSPVGGIMPTPH